MQRTVQRHLAGCTPALCSSALQALEAGEVRKGQRLLVHAGAGGVGSAAIQLAKARGMHVTTTCSAANADFVKQVGALWGQDRGKELVHRRHPQLYRQLPPPRGAPHALEPHPACAAACPHPQLGADEVVDYREQRFEEVLKGRPFDLVIDTVGDDYEPRRWGWGQVCCAGGLGILSAPRTDPILHSLARWLPACRAAAWGWWASTAPLCRCWRARPCLCQWSRAT